MAHLSDRQKADLVRQHLDGVPWTRIAEHSVVTVRTLQRWAARIEAGRLERVFYMRSQVRIALMVTAAR